MTNTNKKLHNIELILSVHKHATPLAVLLVGMGVILSPLEARLRYVTIGLLVLSTLLNLLVVERVKRGGLNSLLIQMRMAVNFGTNCILVYILGWHWEPVWLLLLLTPLATAIYGNKKETVFAAVGAAAELLAINGVRWVRAPVPWGNQLVYAAAILLLSLMIHEVSQLKKASG
ncbi:MAG: hypothetical protein A3J74_00250 [Elusimicrobia bacterium RIFCSPHIGHO2_02_FULL_57_9]|nr:MAG: hypothetical protein A3J74_00250 [Elusimicrobia bacterium RIFCSPHIGHO2_02_FULL_57_9]